MFTLDPRIGNTLLDANALDETGDIAEDSAMREILRLHEQGAILLCLPHSVKAEMEHANTPAEIRRNAQRFIFTMKVELTDSELALHDAIRAMIQGNAKPGQHAKDAFHLVESAKYGRHFITKDSRLLKKATEIWGLLRLRVLTPSEFLAAYRTHAELHPLANRH